MHSRLAIGSAIALATIMFVAAVTLTAGRHGLAGDAPGERAQPQIDFVRDIEPIFKQVLHRVPRAHQGAGAVALHPPDTILKGGLSGAPIDPGKSEQSLLIRRVLGLDGEDHMPLDRDPLPDAVIARLRAWIDAGA